jgi:MFS family permease
MTTIQSNRYVVLIVSLGIIITSFESSSIGTILPVVIQKFHSGLQSGKWLVSMYTLIICALLLASGNIGDRFGHHTAYLTGLCITFNGAFLCLLAKSMTMLVCFRAVEAIGIALILANAAALLVNHCSFKKRSRSLGLLSSMAYVGVISGTFFSGILTHAFGWRSVFIVVIMLSGIAIFFTRMISFDDGSPVTSKSTISLKNVLLVVGLGAVFCAIQFVDLLGWHSFIVDSLFMVGLLIMSFSIRRFELTITSGFSGQFVFAVMALFLVYVCLYSVSFVLPFYFRNDLNLEPPQAGLILTLRPLSTALVLPFFGALADKYGPRFFNFLGLLIIFAALFNFTFLQNHTPVRNLVVFLVSMGIGIGAFIAPNHTIIMNSVSISIRGVASATLSLMRNLGMMVGIILVGGFPSAKTAPGFNGSSMQITFQQVLYISLSIIVIALCSALFPSLNHLLNRKKTVSTLEGKAQLLRK